jgi:hypothetical protein
VVGLLAVLLVTASLGLFIVRRGSGGGSSPTTQDAGRTASTGAGNLSSNGYDARVAEDFNKGCVNEAFNTPDFCRCLYDAIRDAFPYSEYVKMNQEVEQGRRIEDTRVWPLANACWKEHPAPPR